MVGLDTAKHKALVQTYAKRSFSLNGRGARAVPGYPQVVVMVSYDEPTEQYQPRRCTRLTVNGAVQPGGGQSSKAVTAKADRF